MTRTCLHMMQLTDAWASVDDETAKDVWTEFVTAHRINGDKFPFTIEDYNKKFSFSIIEIENKNDVPSVTVKDNRFKTQFELPIKFEIFAMSLFENLHHYKLHQTGDDVIARGNFEIDIEYLTVADLDNAVVDYLTDYRSIEAYEFCDSPDRSVDNTNVSIL